jgi:hypothetical protein
MFSSWPTCELEQFRPRTPEEQRIASTKVFPLLNTGRGLASVWRRPPGVCLEVFFSPRWPIPRRILGAVGPAGGGGWRGLPEGAVSAHEVDSSLDEAELAPTRVALFTEPWCDSARPAVASRIAAFRAISEGPRSPSRVRSYRLSHSSPIRDPGCH